MKKKRKTNNKHVLNIATCEYGEKAYINAT